MAFYWGGLVIFAAELGDGILIAIALWPLCVAVVAWADYRVNEVDSCIGERG